jgi:hypothetical protein
MHKMMVGARVDGQNTPDFFGWDEVNDLIRHGMKVVAVVPGEFYQGDLDGGGVRTLIWYSVIVLDDSGIDPPQSAGASDRSDKAPSQEEKRPGEIPW